MTHPDRSRRLFWSALFATHAIFCVLNSSSLIAAPESAQARRSPCELLTKEDVQSVLQTPVSEAIQRGDTCVFEPAGGAARGITLTVRWSGGATAMEAAHMAERAFRDSGSLFKELGHSNDDVRHLGDDASFNLKTLYVLKGDTMLKFDAERCSRAQAITLATKALRRLKTL